VATPTYPTAIKVFPTYHDYSDVIFAHSINELHDEVGSIELTLGVNPTQAAPSYVTSIGGAITDLYNTKAPKAHQHTHGSLPDDVYESDGSLADDHLQYIRCDGTRPFTGPVMGQWATQANHLIPLGQVQSFGYINLTQANNLILSRLTNLIVGGLGGPPLYGTALSSPNWILTGGFQFGCTNSGGFINNSFGNAFGTVLGSGSGGGMVQAFVATKTPAWGSPNPGCAPYNYIEAQLTLSGIDNLHAMVQFSHDYSFQRNLWVAYTWMAIGARF
jgi:hypothetical protein